MNQNMEVELDLSDDEESNPLESFNKLKKSTVFVQQTLQPLSRG